MVIQVLPDPAREGTLAQWARPLAPDGIIAIGIWNFGEHVGPHELWAEAAKAVNPNYVNPPLLPPRHWTGRKELEEGLEVAGFRDVRSEELEIGFDVGKEGFMKFFGESGNPMTGERQASFRGDLGLVKGEMERSLDEVYDVGERFRCRSVWRCNGNR